MPARWIKFLARRFAAAMLTMAGAILLLFIIIQFVPGDLITIMLGPRATPELREAFAERMGLDRSVLERLWVFFSHAVRGDFGSDVLSNRPIGDIILEVLPHTLQLAFAAMLIGGGLGVLLGCIAALRPGSRLDSFLGFASVAFITTPSFVVAIFLLLTFSLGLHWLPVTGAGDPSSLTDRLAHLVLPASALAIGWIGYIARLMRASLLEVMSEQHIKMMRAYGVPERRIIGRFALKLALVPLVTVIGLGMGDLIGSAVFTEIIFARPGIGSLIYNSIMTRNYPVAQAGLLVLVLVYVCANLFVDIINSLIDPRIARSLDLRGSG
ncbi:MAG TPA: ABC transporter permease [Aestuariivirgaceae bacterium]|nr:ABC transporter permease [Aestuariivirgaceae bacterium]